MQDIEKTRVEYVARLEQQLQHLQRQLDEAKPLAEKWTPKVAGDIDVQSGEVRVTLAFGGKRTTATIAASAFNNNTLQDLTYSIANTLAESLFIDRIVEVIKPEVDRLMQSSKAAQGAGKW